MKPSALFRARLREVRAARGVTQVDLAEKVGTTQATIARLESGSRSLTLDTAADLAGALGLSLEEMLSTDDRLLCKASIRDGTHAPVLSWWPDWIACTELSGHASHHRYTDEDGSRVEWPR